MTAKHDLSLLAKLLNQTPDVIFAEALSCYVNGILSPDLRAVYTNFIEAAARTAPDAKDKAVAKRYRVASIAMGMRFNPGKTRGGIIAALQNRHDFAREDFRQVVAEVMSWGSPGHRPLALAQTFEVWMMLIELGGER